MNGSKEVIFSGLEEEGKQQYNQNKSNNLVKTMDRIPMEGEGSNEPNEADNNSQSSAASSSSSLINDSAYIV